MATFPETRAKVTTSGADTDTVLVAAPAAGKVIVVTKVFVATLTANVVDLGPAGAAEMKLYMGANAVFDSPHPGEQFRCLTAGALTYTTSAAVATFIAVNYRVEDA